MSWRKSGLPAVAEDRSDLIGRIQTLTDIGMASFLETLFTTGKLVSHAESLSSHQRSDEQILCQAETVWRSQQPLNAPLFHVDSAMKAGMILEAACKAVVHREMNIEQVEQQIQHCNLTADDNDAGVHYSVDLVLRFLPQVADRAARISDSDALLEIFQAVARPWPLSSVGMKTCKPAQLPEAFQNASLWKMYIDRVISRKDMSRLDIPSVRDAVMAAIGPFHMLAPQFVVHSNSQHE